MKVSEVVVNDIVKYLKLSDGEYDIPDIQMLIDASKAFIKSYTGLTDTAVDLHEDITIVLYVLCQDMHDNRTMYIDKNSLNKVVNTILGMYRTNFLPTVSEVVV